MNSFAPSTLVVAMVNLLASSKKESWWRRQDWVLTIAALSLSFIGLLTVWAATRPRLIDIGTDPEAYLKRHGVILIIGLILGILVARLRYTMLRAYAPILYGAGVLGLIAVLIIGVEVNGITAWIQLPAGFTLQPSEFAKLAIIIGMSMVLSETRQRDDLPSSREVLLALGVAAVPVGLIMLQPDLGTTVVIGFFVFALLAAAGIPTRWLQALTAVGIAGIALVWTVPGILSDYQKDRLLVFINPEFDPLGAGYNLRMAQLAIGSGGMSGTGLFNGPQTNGKFVPEQQTDFIFSALGEELGFIGSALVISLLIVVCWRALKIAQETNDRFGRIAATGVAMWIAFQAFENIGMNLGMMPITGVPLPFISYGGSSIFAIWMAVGLLQNIKIAESK
jgi:rod shape determining protein RodA